MTTPRGAKHRDLEQRLRDIEAQLRELTAASLRRKQLGVSQGDFVVSGGGNVVVKDGGDLEILDAGGAVVFSALDGPVKVSKVNQTHSGWTTGPTGHTETYSVTVPEGYTKVFAFGSVSARARNNRTVWDALQISGTDATTDVSPGKLGHVSWSNVSVATGLVPGSTFQGQFTVNTVGDTSWGSDTWNSCTVNCLYIWQR